MENFIPGGSQEGHRNLRYPQLLYLIRGRFAGLHFASFGDAQVDQFEALPDCTDPDLLDWIIARSAPPPDIHIQPANPWEHATWPHH